MTSIIIGFNNTFIEDRPLSGPGYYAIQLLENILRLSPEQRAPFTLKVFAQEGTEHHYSDEARSLIVKCPSVSGRISRVAWEQLLLPARVRREKVDLLLSPGFVSPLFGAKVMAATIHDMYYRVIPEVVEKFQKQYWRAFIPLSSQVSDILFTVSENSRRDIERYIPAARGKVVVTPLASRFTPIESENNQRRIVAERPYVLMIANLTPNKNVGRVVEALAILRDRGRNVDLVHIGIDLRGELAKSIAAHAMEDHVRSLGKVDDATLVETAQSSLCVVVSSIYEGFGMPALEAQALGTPLICSNRGALPEVVGDAALMFDPEDAQELASRISQLIDNPDLQQQLSALGLANARRFSWELTASLTLSAFRRELQRHGLL
ncbi:MAG: glycosyltransferase family 4 protein [Porphyrobacter sp.]|nr:glycosyltransferase family 4 protein [Porphyrobacter sp.]